MKTRMNLSAIWWVLLALLGSLGTANAHYDPNTQRWLNRDPIGEPGFENVRQSAQPLEQDPANLFSFVRNDPLNNCDLLGLALTEDDYYGRIHLQCLECWNVIIVRGRPMPNLVFRQCFYRREKCMNKKAFEDCAGPLEAEFARQCRRGNIAPLSSLVRRIQNCYNHHW